MSPDSIAVAAYCQQARARKEVVSQPEYVF
jgi:hypothetical protein